MPCRPRRSAPPPNARGAAATALADQVPSCAPQDGLAQARMAVGAEDDIRGADAGRGLEQDIGNAALAGICFAHFRLHEMPRKIVACIGGAEPQRAIVFAHRHQRDAARFAKHRQRQPQRVRSLDAAVPGNQRRSGGREFGRTRRQPKHGRPRRDCSLAAMPRVRR